MFRYAPKMAKAHLSYRQIFGWIVLAGLTSMPASAAVMRAESDLPATAGLSEVGERPFLEQIRRLRAICEDPFAWRELRTQAADQEPRQWGGPLKPCLEALDAFHVWLGEAGAPAISDKEASSLDLAVLLDFVMQRNETLRQLTLAGSPPTDQPRLAEGVTLEQGVRRALSRLNAYESWEGAVTLRAGFLRTHSGLRAVGGLRASLRVDLGERIDGQAEVETSSPRKEGAGLITIPPVSSDVVGLSQLWVRTRQIPRLHFWVGIRPEDNNPTAPERWPFLSIGSVAVLVPGPLWDIDLGIRHDGYGLWDATTDLYRPSRLERNQSFLSARAFVLRQFQSSLQLNMRSAVEWYSDPEGVLRRLSLGRYDDVRPDFDRSDPYRIVKFDGSARLRLGPSLLIEPQLTAFWNLESRRDRMGLVTQVSSRFQWSAWLFSADIYDSDIGCDAAPPVALARHLFPGQRARGGRLGVTFLVSERVALEARTLAQRVGRLTSSPQCAWGSDASQDKHMTIMTAALGVLVTLGPPPAVPGP